MCAWGRKQHLLPRTVASPDTFHSVSIQVPRVSQEGPSVSSFQKWYFRIKTVIHSVDYASLGTHSLSHRIL